MNNLHMTIYLSVGIMLAFAFNHRRELLGGRPNSANDDGSECLLWFFLCSGIWPLMLVAALYAKARKPRGSARTPAR